MSDMNGDSLDLFEESDFPVDDNTNADDEQEADTFDEGQGDDEAGAQDEQGDEVVNEVAPVKLFKVRVNHQDMEIPEQDAHAYIQKGLDYDRVKGQVESFKNDPRLSFVENLAQQNNMSVDEYLGAYHTAQYNNELYDLISQGIPEDVASELLDNRKAKLSKAEEERIAKEQNAGQADLRDFMDYFAKAHGRQFNIETDELPANIWDTVNAGTPLKVAYMEHLLSIKDAEKADLQKKQEARAKAPVKGTGYFGSGASPKKDKLFDGLFEN